MSALARKTTNEIIAELGSRVRATRLRRNLAQLDLARQAGLSDRTIRSLERGQDVQLSTLIEILRVLRRLDDLDGVLPDPGVSPIQLLKNKGRPRQRARRKDG
jgi:transcriptional regulator with XRE-family HTH domain